MRQPSSQEILPLCGWSLWIIRLMLYNYLRLHHIRSPASRTRLCVIPQLCSFLQPQIQNDTIVPLFAGPWQKVIQRNLIFALAPKGNGRPKRGTHRGWTTGPYDGWNGGRLLHFRINYTNENDKLIPILTLWLEEALFEFRAAEQCSMCMCVCVFVNVWDACPVASRCLFLFAYI